MDSKQTIDQVQSLILSGDKSFLIELNKLMMNIPELTRKCTGCGMELTRDKYYQSSRKKAQKTYKSWSINQPCKECAAGRNKKVMEYYNPKKILY
jgi:hypothetical protein